MYIQKATSRVEKEPLIVPFGFKGGYCSELWQVITHLQTDSVSSFGMGVQSVLWSDAAVFVSRSQDAANESMYAVTQQALKLIENQRFDNPWSALDGILDECLAFGRSSTGVNVRTTFALNALVGVDAALWQAYGREAGTEDFCSLLPDEFKQDLSKRQDKLAAIPLVTYGVGEEGIRALLDDGACILKIKIGCDPDGDGDREKMLAWDMKRASQIHRIASNYITPYTESGKIAYYFDANGRYDSRDRLLRFVEHLVKIGADKQTVLLEEPFDEHEHISVDGIPLRIAADESAHNVADTLARLDMGYSAVALKPIAKTMSESICILHAATQRNIPCFCADLTVNPLMVEWNKNIAARIAPLPGMKIGVLESNGRQNYSNWQKMCMRHPCANESFALEKDGIFTTNVDFFKVSGGIFKDAPQYEKF